MAGHRRDDQELGLIGSARELGTNEAQQIAERPAPDDVLEDRSSDAVDRDFVETEGRLAVAARHPFEQFRAGGDVLAERRVGERIPGIAEDEMRRVGHRARRRQRGMSHFVELIGIAWRHEDGPVTGGANESSDMPAYRCIELYQIGLKDKSTKRNPPGADQLDA